MSAGDDQVIRCSRPAVITAVAVARLLTRARPRRIRWVLVQLRRGARAATEAQALAARQAVMAASARCRGQGCLQRSLAAVLLCRMAGVWPDWCTGVRTAPFRAHAWIEVNGIPIGEPTPADYYRPMMSVPHHAP